MLTRRSAALGLGAAPFLASAAQAAEGLTLRAAAQKGGLLYGSAVRTDPLASDSTYRDILARECSILTPESSLKWGNVVKAPGQYDFTNAEKIYKFAQQNNAQMRGHCLLWHKSLPTWWGQLADQGPQAVRKALLKHVETMVRAWKGRVKMWDVANEYLDAEGNGYKRELVWQFVDPAFIADCFTLAHETDPNVQLVYNDFGFGQSNSARRSNDLLGLLDAIKARTNALHAVGLQSHIFANKPIDEAELNRLVNSLISRGFRLHLTELDVRDQILLPSAMRDGLMDDTLKKYLAPFIASKSLDCVITWGITDKYTWLNERPDQRRLDGSPYRGLPYDADYRPKPMRDVLVAALQRS